MSALIKGWCPSAYRPMMSGDGLVVRVKPRYSSVTPEQLRMLADLSEEFGSGLTEVTSRANLQIRGVQQDSFQLLLDRLKIEGLVDQNPDIEARRSFILSPFRNEAAFNHEAIADALTADLVVPEMPELPSKFGFVIDVNPEERHLCAAIGDVRIETSAYGKLIVRADGSRTGKPVSNEKEAVELAIKMVRWFADSGGIGTDGRGRMRRHIEKGAKLPVNLRGNADPARPTRPLHPGTTGSGYCVGSPFGLFSGGQLRLVADHSASVIRVTPDRLLVLDNPDAVEALAGKMGLITNKNDPVFRVFGCTGKPGCSQATVETRSLAKELSSRIRENAVLHVSGCSKGCARSGSADICVVGNNGRYDLVENGCASDVPRLAGLSREDIQMKLGDVHAV